MTAGFMLVTISNVVLANRVKFLVLDDGLACLDLFQSMLTKIMFTLGVLCSSVHCLAAMKDACKAAMKDQGKTVNLLDARADTLLTESTRCMAIEEACVRTCFLICFNLNARKADGLG